MKESDKMIFKYKEAVPLQPAPRMVFAPMLPAVKKMALTGNQKRPLF